MKKKIRLHGLSSGISWEKVGSSKPDRLDEPYGSILAQDRLDQSRFYIFYLVTFIILAVFLARLFGLTIVAGEKNRELSENNRIRLVVVPAERGRIFDRDGRELAKSERIYVLRSGDSEEKINEQQARDLESEGLAGEMFSGSLGRITQEVQRDYSLGMAASHVLGYTSIVQAEDVARDSSFTSSESVGRLGIEASYDDFLRGRSGRKLVEVDAAGRKVSILGNVEQSVGRDIHLTIDADLQKVSYESLLKQAGKIGSKKGAVIVQNPNTGEVLALVSVPSFDGEDVGKSVRDLDKPFFNRVTLGTYPPGSVFKVVSALAALESGKITKDTEIEDVGAFEIAGTRFSNWYFTQYGSRDGILKIDRAIARSNDIFFYKVGEEIGLDALRGMAIKLGFGQKSGVDLPDEAFGLVPDEVWKKSTFGDGWFLGDTMHLAIGQGFMLSTPMQINSMISFVSSGQRTQPFLVSRIAKGDEGEEINISGKMLEGGVGEESLKIVREGMKQACQKGGTGWPFFDARYTVGCKTGTAEKTLGNPHAWFSAYAPLANPEVAITVLIEEGGEGSSIAGPVAREILDFWYRNK